MLTLKSVHKIHGTYLGQTVLGTSSSHNISCTGTLGMSTISPLLQTIHHLSLTPCYTRLLGFFSRGSTNWLWDRNMRTGVPRHVLPITVHW